MRASELRIGNYLQAKQHRFTPEQVTMINGQWVDGMPEDHFEGIPLTEEWLGKFGFKGQQVYESVSDYWIPDGYQTKGHKVQTDGETFVFMGYKDGIEIEYVHQLQNLYFALTGEELPLNAS